jgi:hypothetical protein
VELDPKNALAWSDLASAHLQPSAKVSDPYELMLALSAANRAVQLDPNLIPAHFNRALALERLALRDQALADEARARPSLAARSSDARCQAGSACEPADLEEPVG